MSARRRGRRIATLAVVLALFGTGGAFAAKRFTSYDEGDGEMVWTGGVLRVGPSWYIHTNDTHAAVNIEGMSIDADGDLVVRVSGARKIVACIAEEDETISRLGIQVGCSGGQPTAILQFWKDGDKVRADSSILGSNSNIWFLTATFERTS